MNALTGKAPLAKVRGFNGVWSRGADSSCPPDHLTDCNNCSFPGPGQVSIRDNFSVQSTIASRTIISFAIATLSGGPILLTLNSTGNFYDETHATLLGNFVGADDFVCLSIYGRCYISMRTKGAAYAGGSLYNYDGITFRTCGWAAPVTQCTLTQPNAGHVDIGIHEVAVAFVSPTGALSKPSPTAAITSAGAKSISISAIPTGPAGTTQRVLLMTKANQGELFFVPGGTINDNVTTTFEYNLFDTALIESADYLNDLLFPVPSCAALKFFSGRLVMIGRDAFPDQIPISNQNAPETYNLVNNVLNLPVDYGINTAAGGMVIRDVLYITKANATYSTMDNGSDPNTWHVSTVDSGLGAYDTGISTFASSMSAQDILDSSLIANKRGLHFFNGSFGDKPLTYKIESIWNKIDQNNAYRIQVAHNIWDKLVYIAVPLQPAGSLGQRISSDPGGLNNILLVMDYKEGLEYSTVKWTVWTPGGPYKKIGVENFLLNYGANPVKYQFAYVKGNTVIYQCVPATLPTPDTDTGGALTSIKQAIVTAPLAPGGITVFTGLTFTFQAGNKAVTPSLFNKNRTVGPIAQKTFALDQYDLDNELFRGINFQHFGLEVALSCSTATTGGTQGYFHLTGLDVYGTVMYSQLPAVQEAV